MPMTLSERTEVLASLQGRPDEQSQALARELIFSWAMWDDLVLNVRFKPAIDISRPHIEKLESNALALVMS